MALKRVARRSVPDEVFEQVLADVVGGELVPGETLPAERRLAEVLGVSRPAVREALQRMAHAGLVEVRQGGATTVRDFRRHAGLDLLPSLLFRGGEPDLAVVRSVLEARLIIGPEVAALAAERANARLGPLLRDAVAALKAEQDPVARQRAAIAFWDHVVDGADSIVFRLLFNGLREAYEPALDALAGIMAAEVNRVNAYRALTDAITARNPTLAKRAAEDLLAPATTEFLKAIERLEEDS
ncbi:FadR/GntR family transcriptional regulator [Amycolatopsis anabasis]|uniref:FadR/GntR family transcriptional regulator n=1 Tax=Amycolatopsis anabasis TaxID=1840409 RepID=UPI00131CED21|nr:GntR family transcriptional regulator [Amycolatopsis anabasis]